MEIHRYEKIWFGVSLLLIVGFISTVAYGAVGAGIEMVDDDGGTVDPESVFEDERFSDRGVEKVGDDEYEVTMIALKFTYLPGEVEVPAGSTVTFYVTSPDVIHGFELVGTNVNTMVIPGQVTEITVEFDEPGEYGIICNEYCGEGHQDMAGKLTVVPEDEWDDSQLEDGGDS